MCPYRPWTNAARGPQCSSPVRNPCSLSHTSPSRRPVHSGFSRFKFHMVSERFARRFYVLACLEAWSFFVFPHFSSPIYIRPSFLLPSLQSPPPAIVQIISSNACPSSEHGHRRRCPPPLPILLPQQASPSDRQQTDFRLDFHPPATDLQQPFPGSGKSAFLSRLSSIPNSTPFLGPILRP